MNTIDALKRLERAGGEHSTTTRKLKDAAVCVAQEIADQLAEAGVEGLVAEDTPWITVPVFRTAETMKHPNLDAFRNGGDQYTFLPEARELRCGGSDMRPMDGEITREEALLFARHVAAGLLDVIAAWLERRTDANSAAVVALT